MSEYIDADKFKDFVDITCDMGGLMYPVVREIKEYVKNQIDGQPTADVRKNEHVEWCEYKDPTIMEEVLGWYKWICNKCFMRYKDKSNFCPHCGADMRKGETNGSD